jgi:DNA/RNA endonuclease G (NUC1)
MKTILYVTILLFVTTFKPITYQKTKFIINHGDIKLSLDNDTCTFISEHNIKWKDFQKLNSDRKDRWHNEKPNGPYNKEHYNNSGYDLGHLTPAHITSYNDTLQYHSFSMFNQAPQLAGFNRGKWKKMELGVEDTISKYKSDVRIITGVVYDNNKKIYLSKSRIKIPTYFYKIISIEKENKTYVWLGSNLNGNVIKINIIYLNEILKKYNNRLTFK